jgi:phage gpG-like protein
VNITVEVSGDDLISLRFSRAPAAYLQVVQEQMQAVVDLLYGEVQANLDGNKLQRRTGDLADSISRAVDNDGAGTVTGTVSSDSPYARIQNRGGVTPPHDIVPKMARALRWEATAEALEGKMSLGMIFRAIVHHPGATIPASRFMSAALSDNQVRIREMFHIDPSAL